MKLNKIINTLSLAAVALLATACADTDAQYSIPDVGAPEFVSESPSTASGMLMFGERTITVKFDKNIGFATKNTSLITLNGSPVKKAAVNGVSTDLTITADVSFAKKQTLVIPAGIIVGPEGKTNTEAISLTWQFQDLPTNDATAMTAKLGWGWNLGNHYETSDMTWGYWDHATPSATTFQKIAAAGAKSVRLPVTWTTHMDLTTNTIDATFLAEVAASVDDAINAGLYVILNTHHDTFETDLGNAANDPATAVKDSTLIADIWTQVANHFKDYGDKLIFETMNEVHAGDNWGSGTDAEYAMLNNWNQYAVDAIRATGGNNSTRWIGVAGYAANIDLTIDHFVLPNDPANRIMVGVHCYDPYNFCLNPMNDDNTVVEIDSWGHNANPATSVAGANEEYVITQLLKLRNAYIEKNIPCYLGEYGCVIQTTERANAFRKYYLEFFCRAAYLAGIPMMVWDNNVTTGGNESNGYIDHTSGDFVADGDVIVPMMIKACTSTDESYWFDTIWNNSPAAE